MGLILLGITSMNTIGLTGSIFHMIGHGLITAGLFMICGIIYQRCKSRDINRLSGIATEMPRLFGFATVIILASIGLPMLAGFVGEVITIIGAMASELTDSMKLIALFSLPMLILSSCYMLKFLHKGFFGETGECKPAFDITNHEFIVLAATLLLLIIFGCYPAAITNIIEASKLLGGSGVW